MPQKRTLDEVVGCIKSCKINVHNNHKNRETRWLLGITIDEQEDMIRSIVRNDYIAGPEKNYDEQKLEEIWKFKRPFRNYYIYVKLYITDSPNEIIESISVHIDNI